MFAIFTNFFFKVQKSQNLKKRCGKLSGSLWVPEGEEREPEAVRYKAVNSVSPPLQKCLRCH